MYARQNLPGKTRVGRYSDEEIRKMTVTGQKLSLGLLAASVVGLFIIYKLDKTQGN